MNSATYLKKATDACLSELVNSQLKHVANAFESVESAFFESRLDGGVEVYQAADIVSLLVMKQSVLGRTNMDSMTSQTLLGDAPKFEKMELQSNIGYLCAAAKVAESQSDNPICYAANPSNYGAIRKGIFAHKSDALAFSQLRRDLLVGSIQSTPPLLRKMTDAFFGEEFESDSICASYDALHKADIQFIEELYSGE